LRSTSSRRRSSGTLSGSIYLRTTLSCDAENQQRVDLFGCGVDGGLVVPQSGSALAEAQAVPGGGMDYGPPPESFQ
jgi:hypothetical protein